MSKPLFELRGLRKEFRASKNAFTLEIDALTIPRGQTIAIVGPSGAGKSTLLNLLGGLDLPDGAGENRGLNMLLADVPAWHAGQGLRSYPRKNVSYIFQAGYLLRSASAGLNLAIPRAAAGLPTATRYVKQWLDCVEFPYPPSHRMQDLSGGEQQRISLGRAFARGPQIILADEPSSSLDPELAEMVMHRLCAWRRNSPDRTVLWVTHDYHLAAALADSLLVLRKTENSEHGRIHRLARIEEGAPIPCPRDAEKLRSIVYPRGDVGTDQAAVPSETGGSRGAGFCRQLVHGAQMAAQELFAPVKGVEGRGEAVRLATRFVARLLWPYAGFTRLLTGLILLVLVALALATQFLESVVEGYFREQLESPEMRHVVVSGDPRNPGTELNQATLDAHGRERPWLTGCKEPARPGWMHSVRAWTREIFPGAQVGNSPSQRGVQAVAVANEPTIFGRLAGSHHATRVESNGKVSASALDLQLLKADAAEPALASVRVYGLNERNSGPLQVLPEPAAKLLKDHEPPYPILVTREFYNKLLSHRAAHLGISEANTPLETVSVEFRSDGVPIRIAGVVDQLPLDRTYIYGGLIDMGTYQVLLGRDGERVKEYERAAFYFDPRSFHCLLTHLNQIGYQFNREIFSKYARSVEFALNLSALFSYIVAMCLGVALAIAVFLMASYLRENQHSLAIMKAHGVGSTVIFSAMAFQIAYLWLFAILHLFLALTLIDYTKSYSAILPTGIDIDPSNLFDLGIWVLIAGTAMISIVVMVLFTAYFLGRNTRLIGLLKAP